MAAATTCSDFGLPDVQAGFREGRGTRDQIANIHWIIEKAREFQKIIYFCFTDYTKAFDCVEHNKLENSERDGNTRPFDLPFENMLTPETGQRYKYLSNNLLEDLLSAGSWKKQESSRKTSISALLTMPKPLTVWITINCGKF